MYINDFGFRIFGAHFQALQGIGSWFYSLISSIVVVVVFVVDYFSDKQTAREEHLKWGQDFFTSFLTLPSSGASQ